MNAIAITAVASNKSDVRTCHIGGILQLGDGFSTLSLRADPILSDHSRLSTPHMRAFRAAVQAIAAQKALECRETGDTDMELIGDIFNVASARAIATLVCGKTLESIPQHRGNRLDFAVREMHVL